MGLCQNEDLTPADVSPQSHLYAYWLCKNGHSFKSRIQNRMLGSRCPYCAGKLPIKYKTDLETSHPELLDEWDYDKNHIKPDEVTAGSEKKVYWIGKCGHSYQQMVINHVNGSGCPVCAGKIVIAGVNDLETAYPDIAKEWDFKKNSVLPSQVSPHSEKKAWWICRNGHSYSMAIGSRTAVKPQGCSVCANELKTSYSEQSVFYYVKQVFPDAVNRDRSMKKELDIYIPSIQTAIEYDGVYWHNSKQKLAKDNEKDIFCQNRGIRLIRFRDTKMPDTVSAVRINCKDGNSRSLQKAIKKLFDILQVECPDVDLSRDSTEILSSYVVNQKENSLANRFPSLCKEWDYDKNAPITPDNIAWGSAKVVYWKCLKCQKEWKCSVANRTGGIFQKCPRCTKKELRKSLVVAVMNIDTGEVFDSVASAARSCNGRGSDISTVCRGNQKTAFGYHWKYIGKSRKATPNYHGRIINLDNGMVFDTLQEAAAWCNGKLLNISACCRGRQKTAYGYRWEFYD